MCVVWVRRATSINGVFHGAGQRAGELFRVIDLCLLNKRMQGPCGARCSCCMQCTVYSTVYCKQYCVL